MKITNLRVRENAVLPKTTKLNAFTVDGLRLATIAYKYNCFIEFGRI